jgi:serine protease
VRPEHPDLAGKLLPGYDMISDLDEANDGDTRDADATDPGDWVSQAEDADAMGPFFDCGAEPSSWHGTMTSSLVGAATNNGAGMAGVAWNVKILPVRAVGKCGGFTSDITAAMRWAAGLAVPGVPVNPNKARVINLSLGSSSGCSATYMNAVNAVTAAPNNVVVVASAGNSSGHDVGQPANCPGVIGVAGLRHAGTKVGFSDLGPQITISAPAGNCVNTGANTPCLYPILAAADTGTTGPVASTYTDSFNPTLGTSFSSPLVAGTVALMLSVDPALTPAQVKAALQNSARPFPSGAAVDPTVPVCQVPSTLDQLECRCTTFTCGAGMLDAAAAVAAVMPAAAVVEFYNSILDNFFVTANFGEAAGIDSGSAGPGWSRTGNSFKPGGSAQVCRFYGSITPGPNSHFYTIDPDECAALKALQATTPATQRRWNFESLDFASTPPSGGACGLGLVPVYRAYNNGFARNIDSNHRITSNFSGILEVVNRGWKNEGVVMCAP